MFELKRIRGIDHQDITLSALEIILDGVAGSESTESTRQAGLYLARLVLADSSGRFDEEKQKAVLSIIEMALEVENAGGLSRRSKIKGK
ncbi:hypothetical protein CW613_001698 [Vibrio mimicus]